MGENLKALAKENTHLHAKCEDLEVRLKSEFEPRRLVSKANIY